jgi:hypothetical protein
MVFCTKRLIVKWLARLAAQRSDGYHTSTDILHSGRGGRFGFGTSRKDCHAPKATYR